MNAYAPAPSSAHAGITEELRARTFFESLSPDQLDRVARKAKRIHLNEGECLFSQGDPAARFYLLLRGQIKLYRLAPSGAEKIIQIVTPGNTFAEALMFLQQPRFPVGAQALQPAEVIGIDAQDFSSMLRDSVDTCFLLLGDISRRLRGLIQEIDNLTLHSATCRVAAYLIQHSPDDGDTLDLSIPKHVLASRLSIKAETFSRIIKTLNQNRLIEVDGSRIRITDRRALERVAEIADTRDGILPQHSEYDPPCTSSWKR